MRLLRSLDEIVIWILILFVATINLAVFTGVLVGERAIDVRTTFAAGGTISAGCDSDPDTNTAAGRAIEAECDASDDLPGTFVPTQGRQHVEAGTSVPFCPEGQVSGLCYASNPPTSGLHLAVQRDYDLGDGNTVNVPPDPGIYDFDIPRESIPHIQEHAGVFVGHQCVTDACRETVEELENLVAQEVDDGKRVIMAPDADLPDDTIAFASWTRVDSFPASEFSEDRAFAFIDAHSCRFDPESFCEDEPDPRDRARAELADPPTL
jgi:hypothetical protein